MFHTLGTIFLFFWHVSTLAVIHVKEDGIGAENAPKLLLVRQAVEEAALGRKLETEDTIFLQMAVLE